MPDILDAAQTTDQPAGVTPPPTDPLPPPPPPPEPAPEPIMPPPPEAPSISTDSLIVPPPEPEVPPSEASAPTIEPPAVAPPPPPPMPQESKKKKGMNPALIIAGFLMLFITIPLVFFGVKQQQEIRSRAAGGVCCPKPDTGNYGINTCTGASQNACNINSSTCNWNASATSCGGGGGGGGGTTPKTCKALSTAEKRALCDGDNPVCDTSTGEWECPGGGGGASNCLYNNAYTVMARDCGGKMVCKTTGWECVTTPGSTDLWCSNSKCPWGCSSLTTDGGVCKSFPVNTCQDVGCPKGQTCINRNPPGDYMCVDGGGGPCESQPKPACKCPLICVAYGNKVGAFATGTWKCPTSCTTAITPACVADNVCMRDNPSIPCCNGSHSVATSECSSGKKCGGSSSVPTPTPTPGGGGGNTPKPTDKPPKPTDKPPGQCIPIKVYNAAGKVLTKAQLAKLKAGTTITFAIKPPVAVTKVRYKVNDAAYKQTTQKNSSGEFIYKYKIPANEDSFTVTAQGFWNNRWY